MGGQKTERGPVNGCTDLGCAHACAWTETALQDGQMHDEARVDKQSLMRIDPWIVEKQNSDY